MILKRHNFSEVEMWSRSRSRSRSYTWSWSWDRAESSWSVSWCDHLSDSWSLSNSWSFIWSLSLFRTRSSNWKANI